MISRIPLSALIIRFNANEQFDHYQLLGIPRYTYDTQVVESAYRQRATEIRSPAAALAPESVNKLLRMCSHAKVVLSDNQQRTEYDREVHQRLAEPPPLSVELAPLQIPSETSARIVGGPASVERQPSPRVVVSVLAVAGVAVLILAAGVWVLKNSAGRKPSNQSDLTSTVPLPPSPPATTPHPPAPPTSATPQPISSETVAPRQIPSPMASLPQLPPGSTVGPSVKPPASPNLVERSSLRTDEALPVDSTSAVVLATPIVSILPPLDSISAVSTLLPPRFGAATGIAIDVSAADLPDGIGIAIVKHPDRQGVFSLVVEPKAGGTQSDYNELVQSGSAALAFVRFEASTFKFKWSERAPAAIAKQLQNCVLTLTCNASSQTVLLRAPVVDNPLIVDLSKSPQQVALKVADPPRKDRLRFELRSVSGLERGWVREPLSNPLLANQRLLLQPKLSLATELHLELAPRSGKLLMLVRPYVTLAEGQRQDFSFEQLTSALVTTESKLRRDAGRFQYLVKRLEVIPDQVDGVRTARITEAQRNANLATLGGEFQAARNGVNSLRRSLPKTEQAVLRLREGEKLAQSLHRRVGFNLRVFAIADTAEIPLWYTEVEAQTPESGRYPPELSGGL